MITRLILVLLIVSGCAREPFEGQYGQFGVDKKSHVDVDPVPPSLPVVIKSVAPFDGAFTGQNIQFGVVVDEQGRSSFRGAVTMVIDGRYERSCEAMHRVIETINGEEQLFAYECRGKSLDSGWHTATAYVEENKSKAVRSTNFFHRAEVPAFTTAEVTNVTGGYRISWKLEEDTPVQMQLRVNNIRIPLPGLAEGSVVAENGVLVGRILRLEAVDRHDNVGAVELAVAP